MIQRVLPDGKKQLWPRRHLYADSLQAWMLNASPAPGLLLGSKENRF
jgi:hypothetical protein